MSHDIVSDQPGVAPDRCASTGLPELDAALGGLYWGDNVAWLLDRASAAPFYRAITARARGFDAIAFVSLTSDPGDMAPAGTDVLDLRHAVALGEARALVAELRRRCAAGARTLLLFEPLDALVARWGARAARLFAACCPVLLGMGAISYWSVSAGAAHVNDAMARTAQCVLRADAQRICVLKAEGRGEHAPGTLLRYEVAPGGAAAVSPPSAVSRVAASLRAVRDARGMSQRGLAALAGVTASAISQAERGQRGLSVDTLLRLSSALGMPLDELVRGGPPPPGYRIGRRAEHPAGELPAVQRLLDAPGAPEVSLIRLAPREHGAPPPGAPGPALVALSAGLLQVVAGDATPVLRHGEVLLSDAATVTGWRNIGDREAQLFWIAGAAAAST